MTIRIPNLISYQKDVIDLVVSGKANDKIVVVKSPRQMGKTATIISLLVTVASIKPGSTSIVVSLTYKNLQELFRTIAKQCRTICQTHGDNNSIEFVNGSRILFLSAATGENVRGFTASGILLFDEAAYINDTFIDACLPFSNRYKVPVILFSTPRFKSGKFWELWKSPDTITVDWSTIPNPFISKEKMETIKSTMPFQLFSADYLGNWMELSSELFGNFEHCMTNISYAYDGGNCYAGIDWGAGGSGDYTSVSIFRNSNMVGLKYFNDKKDMEAIEEIADFIGNYKVTKITVEKNSIGNVFAGLLRKRLQIPIYEFVTTNDSKCKIIEGMISKVKSNSITLLNDNELKLEMSAYQLQPLANGKHTYNAMPGFHDDIIMSTAIALDSESKGTYLIR